MYCGYDYSTPESREETVSALFQRARQARSAVERDWERCNDYYNFIHDVTAEIRESGKIFREEYTENGTLVDALVDVKILHKAEKYQVLE